MKKQVSVFGLHTRAALNRLLLAALGVALLLLRESAPGQKLLLRRLAGLGGVLAVVIAIIFGVLNPFLLSNEVGLLYERRGAEKPVSALTALWFFPGIVILVGPFIWFIRTNDALNAYWRSCGQTRTTLV